MFRSGSFVADQLAPVNDQQVQPNGVDLTVEAVYEQTTTGRISRDGKTIGDRAEIEASGDPPTLHLDPGGYLLEYGETIRVPEQHIGFVLPRSSLLRNSCMLNTAVWDAGYEGRGEGLLQVHQPIEIEVGARVAQFVLAEADHAGTYDGSYQGERLE